MRPAPIVSHYVLEWWGFEDNDSNGLSGFRYPTWALSRVSTQG